MFLSWVFTTTQYKVFFLCKQFHIKLDDPKIQECCYKLLVTMGKITNFVQHR